MQDISIHAESVTDEKGNLFFDVSFRKKDELVEKRISVENFINLLNRNLREDEVYVNVPMLQAKLAGARISSKDKSSFYALYVYEAQKRAFSIAGEFFRLPFPALLFGVESLKGVRQSVTVYALDSDTPGEEAKLYHYPFGNVYENGTVCMGNIVSSKMESLKDAERVFDDFIMGETNEHLYRMHNTMGLTQLELVKYIEKMEEFPSELLLPTQKSLRSFKQEMKLMD